MRHEEAMESELVDSFLSNGPPLPVEPPATLPTPYTFSPLDESLIADGPQGRATINGNNSDNILVGTASNDTIRGYGGNDRINGGDGNDLVYGGTGNDFMWGDAGDDRLYGDAGNDTLVGDKGNDRLYGGAGIDGMFGGGGNDRLDGGSGNDTLYGDGGDDALLGGSGNDTLHGGTGHDSFDGGTGTDALFGGVGNDTLRGGRGIDMLTGGEGADTFLFMLTDVTNTAGSARYGRDTILDFEAGDRIDIRNMLASQVYANLSDVVQVRETADGLSIWVSVGGRFVEVVMLAGIHGLDLDDLLGMGALAT